MSTASPAGTQAAPPQRDTFSSRRVFILAAIGSAVGLGNIWRFPYIAYENGGGAFMIPYAVALVFAGLPLLFFDYAIGHKFRGSPPLSMRRLHPKAEWLGWWHVAVCVVISTYYAVILAWAAMYVWFSLNHSWGDDPAGFFMGEFLQVSDEVSMGADVVPGVLLPLIAVWLVLIVIMALGVNKGVGMLSVIFIPTLILAFGVLVVQSLFLPGAAQGLEAFFQPNWAALQDYKVWMSAIGQIFFSLSVGFGIMITYSSYVDRRTDITNSGLVVGFANSSFELLAGVGVFAALGFMAAAANVAVSEVVSSGIGLAFIAFPTIINQAPGGTLLGVLFFVSLLLAGITSLVSLLEVCVSAVREKLGLARVPATLVICVPIAVASCSFFGTASGLYVLDTVDAFVNSFGILAVAMIAMVLVTWLYRSLPRLRDHLRHHGNFPIGMLWMALIGVILPVALFVMLRQDLVSRIEGGYEGYPAGFVNLFGWGMAISLPIIAILLSLLPWNKKVRLGARHTYDPARDDDTLIEAAEVEAAERRHAGDLGHRRPASGEADVTRHEPGDTVKGDDR